MKIAMVGAGAMGSLFGALLAESGNDVWLLDLHKAHVALFRSRGIKVEREDESRTVAIHAATNPQEIGPSDLTVIFVKSPQTETTLEAVKILSGKTGMVLTLQNGLGNAETIARAITPDRIIAGTTSHGSTLLGPGHIRHAGIGPTVMGLWAGDRKAALDIAVNTCNAAGIACETVEEILPVIWNKLLVNVGINAITALTGIKNGQLLDLAVTMDISSAAVSEAVAVARALGIAVREDAADHVFTIAKATAKNRSSMGQDVDRRRMTEISAINGAVVREAKKAGVAVPVNRTLTALVETVQTHYPK